MYQEDSLIDFSQEEIDTFINTRKNKSKKDKRKQLNKSMKSQSLLKNPEDQAEPPMKKRLSFNLQSPTIKDPENKRKRSKRSRGSKNSKDSKKEFIEKRKTNFIPLRDSQVDDFLLFVPAQKQNKDDFELAEPLKDELEFVQPAMKRKFMSHMPTKNPTVSFDPNSLTLKSRTGNSDPLRVSFNKIK